MNSPGQDGFRSAGDAVTEGQPAQRMTFEQAGQVRLPFGNTHKGQTLMEILDEDPKYLDWLHGRDLYGRLREAVNVFMANGAVQRAIDKAVFD